MPRTTYANGNQMKRGRRFSVQTRDEIFEWLRRRAISSQRSVAGETAHLIEQAREREARTRRRVTAEAAE